MCVGLGYCLIIKTLPTSESFIFHRARRDLSGHIFIYRTMATILPRWVSRCVSREEIAIPVVTLLRHSPDYRVAPPDTSLERSISK